MSGVGAEEGCECWFEINDNPSCPVWHDERTITGGLDPDIEVVELIEEDA